MTDRTIVITGASDGIGAAAAHRLTRRGERVVIVGRSERKTAEVAGRVGATHHVADFARLDEVRSLASTLQETCPRIDILVNNAGATFGAREDTVDGHEKTLQVNHLAPFLLTNLLMDRLVESSASVINTSSRANSIFGKLDIEDLDARHGYVSTTAYGNAKLANILFTRELHRRYHSAGISTAAFHPGNVATNFANGSDYTLNKLLYRSPLKYLLTSPDKGADTLTWLASTQPGAQWESGEYYYRRRVATANQQAYDTALADELWDRSEAMTERSVGW